MAEEAVISTDDARDNIESTWLKIDMTAIEGRNMDVVFCTIECRC